MRKIDERAGDCPGCGGHDICTCAEDEFQDNEIIERDYVFEDFDNDIDFSDDDYDYPYEASYGRLNLEWCEDCQEFMESPHNHIEWSSGHAEGW